MERLEFSIIFIQNIIKQRRTAKVKTYSKYPPLASMQAFNRFGKSSTILTKNGRKIQGVPFTLNNPVHKHLENKAHENKFIIPTPIG